MTWVVLSLFTALFQSLKDVFSKKTLAGVDEYVTALAMRLYALPPVLILWAWTRPPFDLAALDRNFWIALIIGGTLNAVTTVLYMKAIKASDLSVTMPMLAFSPLFLTMTSPLILGEVPAPAGGLGILLIVAGSYLMNIRELDRGAWEPFKALLRETGPRLMLLTAAIWAIAGNYDKIGVMHSSPLFWVIAIDLFVCALLAPLALIKSRGMGALASQWRALVPIGLCESAGLLCQMTALTTAIVPYVIAIKRTSMLMSVCLGAWLFHEPGFRDRITGATIMLIGALCIVLAG